MRDAAELGELRAWAKGLITLTVFPKFFWDHIDFKSALNIKTSPQTDVSNSSLYTMPPGPSETISLAKTLPTTLLRFFRKFPPRQPPTEPIPPSTKTTTTESGDTYSIAVPNNRHVTTLPPLADPAFNPFLPWLNPQTKKWRSPVYSLRRQADLCKLARKYGIEELLPWSPKMIAVKRAKKDLLGVRVKGTGVGQNVKGHKWERHMIVTQDKRRKAMENMPELIEKWKSVSDATRIFARF
jgi:large subunit ribosomal protein L25